MDRKTLEDIFQEIIMNLEEMKPTNMGGLADKTLDDMHKFGEALMQWKLQQWNTELRQETCSECGSKVENRLRSTQVSTECDKKLQGEHFDHMEVWDEIMERVYMGLDGVMINLDY